ncbi:MAG: ribosome small subunit-dependent GTPase A [candidate division Zixibacteria bacterium]
MDLHTIGWDKFFSDQFAEFHAQGLIPARVAAEHRDRYIVWCEAGEMTAEVSGRFSHTAISRADYPSVGDWVALAARPKEGAGTIQALLKRKSSFARRAVLGGKTDKQVLATNVDTVFLVSGLDNEFNVERIRRYVTAAFDSGAMPVVLLNKADICDNIDECLSEVEAMQPGIVVYTLSAVEGTGLEVIDSYLQPGSTVAFLGSSGVGKSTIINALTGQQTMATGAVREDDSRGRHTTTHRELFRLKSGAMAIDTPGMREFEIFAENETFDEVYSDVNELIIACRFADCQHETEPGCAIQFALRDGSLDRKRYESFLKLGREKAHLERRSDVATRRRESREWSKRVRNHHKEVKEAKKRGLL